MAFNGPGRELHGNQNYLEESVYCTRCGTIFVRNPTGRSCPSCTLAERLEEIEEQLDDLGAGDEAIAEHIVDAHETIDDRLEDVERRLDRAERDIDLVDGGL
ncbi:hypothetical protein [Natronorubrum sp. FCH18a]|uniref:hypothetical protein n=1 Tax=Natronorubrum sp. FCH18a TaxID=3447018 RepID=UPI003F50E91D